MTKRRSHITPERQAYLDLLPDIRYKAGGVQLNLKELTVIMEPPGYSWRLLYRSQLVAFGRARSRFAIVRDIQRKTREWIMNNNLETQQPT